MSSADMEGTDIRKAAIEVVRVLHENKIPIVLAQSVFKEAMELIERNTIPYSPKAFSTMDSATFVGEAYEKIHIGKYFMPICGKLNLQQKLTD